MRKFIRKFAPAIKEYLEFRVAMGRSTCHEGHLQLFDHFCYERYPEVDTLSKVVVLDWIAQESAKEPKNFSPKFAHTTSVIHT